VEDERSTMAEPLGRGEPPPRCSARGWEPVRIALLCSTVLPGGGRSPGSFAMGNGTKSNARRTTRDERMTARRTTPTTLPGRLACFTRRDHLWNPRNPWSTARDIPNHGLHGCHGWTGRRHSDGRHTEANHLVAARRRLAAPREAGSQFGSPFSARPECPAAIAHRLRSPQESACENIGDAVVIGS
jgi:hypothetical protein